MFNFAAVATLVLFMSHGADQDQLIIHGISGIECADAVLHLNHKQWFRDDSRVLWHVDNAICIKEQQS